MADHDLSELVPDDEAPDYHATCLCGEQFDSATWWSALGKLLDHVRSS